MVPRKTIENYEKAPQGFAAIWKRRREAEKAELKAEILENENEEMLEALDDINYNFGTAIFQIAVHRMRFKNITAYAIYSQREFLNIAKPFYLAN